MEEKNKKAKVVRLKDSPAQEKPADDGQDRKKATYEELNNYCVQLLQQNQRLTAQVRQMDVSNMLRRLDYLFKVVENEGCFDGDFVEGCVSEIKGALTPPKGEDANADGGGKEG